MRNILCRLSTILIIATLLFVLMAQLYRMAHASEEPFQITVISDDPVIIEHPWHDFPAG